MEVGFNVTVIKRGTRLGFTIIGKEKEVSLMIETLDKLLARYRTKPQIMRVIQKEVGGK